MATATLEPPGTAADAPPDDELHWACEAEACAADPSYLVDRYGKIDRPRAAAAGGDESDADLEPEDRGQPAGPVPFRLWAAQVALIGTLATERLVVILKARQLGISWLVCGYVLWLCLFSPGQVCLLLSKGQKESNELIRRIKALYERLPEGLRRRLPSIVPPNSVRTITWTNGSRIEAMPATKSAGISYTASLVVMDEAAHMLHGEALYDAIKPTMEAGGQLVMLSTANGVGGLFHTIWARAIAGLNSFKAVFLPWWSRPGRDAAWYARIVAESNEPDKVPENYPANPNEAFRASGRARFPLSWILLQSPNVRKPLPDVALPDALRRLPGLKVYQLPRPGRKYVVVGDVAEGKETGDADAATVLDYETWEEVALLHGRWEPDQFADFLIPLGRAYHSAPMGQMIAASQHAPILVERNNHGHAVLATLRLRGYPNIASGQDKGQGWLTGGSNKPAMIDLLAEALRCGLITVRSQQALDEFQNYYRLKGIQTGAACFIPGTKVLGSDGVPLSIDTVESGHTILSHLGQRRAVQETQTRDYDGEVVAIKASGVPVEIVATPEHPFWAMKRTIQLQRRKCHRRYFSEWVEASELKPGDWLAVPKRVGLEPTDLSPERLYAIGFWLAEGHLIRDKYGAARGIGLTNTRTDLIGPASDTLAEWFTEDRVFRGNQFSGYQSVASVPVQRMGMRTRGATKTVYEWEHRSRQASDYFAGHFGFRSRDKKVSDDLFQKSGLLPLACGFIDGEGHQRAGQQRDLGLATTSDALAWQIRQILIDNGVWCTIRRVEATRIWHLNVKASFLHKLEWSRIVEPVDVRACSHVFEDERAFYTAIRGVERRPYKGPVHNFKVDGEESYVAGGVAVHNCGMFDDIVMTWAIALSWLREQRSATKHAEPAVGGASSRPTGFMPTPGQLSFPGR